jgi:hypothetical protein
MFHMPDQRALESFPLDAAIREKISGGISGIEDAIEIRHHISLFIKRDCLKLMRCRCYASARENRGRIITTAEWLFVPVDCIRSESGHTDRDILGTVGSRSAVTHPFPGSLMNALASLNGRLAPVRFHTRAPRSTAARAQPS